LPKRKDKFSLGTDISLSANHYTILFNPKTNINLFQYHVVMSHMLNNIEKEFENKEVGK
jgi:hypothetical protein